MTGLSIAPTTRFLLKRSRLLFASSICFGFVALDVLLAWPHAADFAYFSAIYLHFGDITAALLFGAFGVYWLAKVFDRSPAFTIDSEGIIDSTYFGAYKRVLWGEIKEIKFFKFRSQTSVIVKLIEPEKFLIKRGILMRMLGRMSLALYGSPIVIGPALLGLNAPQLARFISDSAAQYGYELTLPPA
ncbi:STM3941 family protein [Variovorax sp. Varisp36]|uniref:STM3941 family protein n=1 Tax=Variovorax sp. Varisp36 TaxID=3243031 RepID=UPI0039A478A5